MRRFAMVVATLILGLLVTTGRAADPSFGLRTSNSSPAVEPGTSFTVYVDGYDLGLVSDRKSVV